MTLSRTIFKSMIAQFMGRFYTSLISFVVTMVMLARLLTPDQFGVFNFYLTLFYIFNTIIDFGLNTIVIREASQNAGRLTGLALALMRLRGIMAVICMLVVWGIALCVEDAWDFRLLIFLASTHLLFNCLGGFSVVFHVHMRFDRVALAAALGHTLFLAISVMLFAADFTNPAYYLIAYGVGVAGTNLANLVFSRRFMDQGIRGTPEPVKGLFKEALPLGISTIMVTLYFYIDTVLLRLLAGEAEVGYYNAAYRILAFSLMVPVLFNQVIFPVLSRCFNGEGADGARLERIFRRAVLYLGVTGLPVSAALLFLAEPVIVLVSGPTYASSARCLAILGLALAVIFLTYPHISVLIASGRQKLFAWIAGVSGLFNLLLNLWLIPEYSIEGAAWATVVTEALVLLCAIACAWKYTRLHALSPEMVKIPLLTAVVAVVACALRAQPLYASLPALVVLFAVALFLMKLLPFDIQDEDRD
jgi:O-antigen/teichoic acid export membrane protein